MHLFRPVHIFRRVILVASSGLFEVHLDDVIVLHLESFGCFVIIDSSPVVEEAKGSVYRPAT